VASTLLNCKDISNSANLIIRIVPVTAHAAFNKAAEYLKIKLHYAPIDPVSLKVDVHSVSRLINRNTVMVKSPSRDLLSKMILMFVRCRLWGQPPTFHSVQLTILLHSHALPSGVACHSTWMPVWALLSSHTWRKRGIRPSRSISDLRELPVSVATSINMVLHPRGRAQLCIDEHPIGGINISLRRNG
jgi:hypothetical protein